MSWLTRLFRRESAPAPANRGEPRYETSPSWGQRRFESAETTRLNQAHWTHADDQTVNVWLAQQLPVIRARAIYEARQNGIVQGMINTHADDVVGQDGPTLQVLSDDDAYNQALERLWREWFACPTPRANVSGAALLKLWVRNLWKCGEFVGRIATDPKADTQIQMRLLPIHPRRLVSPAGEAGNPNVTMGVRFDEFARPVQYYIADANVSGTYLQSVNAIPYPPDLVIHEFVLDEEDQARGIPWLNTGLQPAADLRDYDDQVQDAARQMADQSGILYTEDPDAPYWDVPESTTIERRTLKMAPPKWKPFVYPATMPPVQYPDYRAERMRELGRPVGMPLLMIRLDASKHNYSSARLDTQCYRRAVAGIQSWIAGTERSTGTLNRLVDEIAREARFSVRELRRRPPVVMYRWTWPAMPHVDPTKEANAEATSLENGTMTLGSALAARGMDLESHVEAMVRERELLEQAGIDRLPWLVGAPEQQTQQPAQGQEEDEEDKANATA